MAIDVPHYIIDQGALRREGKRVTLTTQLDISPEGVLMHKLKLYTDALVAGVPVISHSLPSTWRKRLAHVTET
jgi:hypothetical protein